MGSVPVISDVRLIDWPRSDTTDSRLELSSFPTIVKVDVTARPPVVMVEAVIVEIEVVPVEAIVPTVSVPRTVADPIFNVAFWLDPVFWM